MSALGRKRTLQIPVRTAGLLRESVLHRYAQYCNCVRGRLLIYYLKQSVNIQDLDSGGWGRRFESSHPDQFFPNQINSLSRLPFDHCLLRECLCGSFAGETRRNLSLYGHWSRRRVSRALCGVGGTSHIASHSVPSRSRHRTTVLTLTLGAHNADALLACPRVGSEGIPL